MNNNEISKERAEFEQNTEQLVSLRKSEDEVEQRQQTLLGEMEDEARLLNAIFDTHEGFPENTEDGGTNPEDYILAMRKEIRRISIILNNGLVERKDNIWLNKITPEIIALSEKEYLTPEDIAHFRALYSEMEAVRRRLANKLNPEQPSSQEDEKPTQDEIRAKYAEIEQQLSSDDISDDERIALIRDKGALLEQQTQGKTDSLENDIEQIKSDSENDLVRLTKLQELFARRFAGRFGRIPHFEKVLPGGISLSVIRSEPESLVMQIAYGDWSKNFLIYPSGKIEGGIPKSWPYNKIDLLETLISAIDLYGDNFFADTVEMDVSGEDIGIEPLLVDGEIVPPDEGPDVEWKDGSHPVEERPNDPRREMFYKSLPGVLFSMSGTINTRRKGYGSKGVPYIGFVFPDHVILDCLEVGNAIFIGKLETPLQVEAEQLRRPAGDRISHEEKVRFKNEIWGPNYQSIGKEDLRNSLGFQRIYHPRMKHDDDRYFEIYKDKLSQYIDFSRYEG